MIVGKDPKFIIVINSGNFSTLPLATCKVELTAKRVALMRQSKLNINNDEVYTSSWLGSVHFQVRNTDHLDLCLSVYILQLCLYFVDNMSICIQFIFKQLKFYKHLFKISTVHCKR
jgi:hypothetical protein